MYIWSREQGNIFATKIMYFHCQFQVDTCLAVYLQVWEGCLSVYIIYIITVWLDSPLVWARQLLKLFNQVSFTVLQNASDWEKITSGSLQRNHKINTYTSGKIAEF